MKIQIRFKDPDALHESINHALENSSPDENSLTCDDIYEMISETKYIQWGEYITVEFDTDSKEMILVKDE